MSLVNLFSESAAATTQQMNPLLIRVLDVSYSGEITLEISNSSKDPIRIWKDSNSWGAARWRVLLVRKGHLQTFFQDPDQDFTVNKPTFTEIPGGARIEQRLNPNGGDWRGLEGQKIAFVPGDVVIVVYDVPFTPESLKLGVWYGVSAASTTVQ